MSSGRRNLSGLAWSYGIVGKLMTTASSGPTLRSACQTPRGMTSSCRRDPTGKAAQRGRRRHVVALVVEDELELAAEECVAILVHAVDSPTLGGTRTDRERVREHERVWVDAPAEVVELADGSALVGLGDKVPQQDSVRERGDALATRCHRLCVLLDRHGGG